MFFIFSLTIHATFTDTPPVIDGRIEDVWKRAEPVTAFFQQEPDNGEPATESTEVYILTDREALYFGVICHTPGRHPDARVTEWDNVTGDLITFILDTFRDGNTAYVFKVSAGGAQCDGIVSAGGSNWCYSWNGVWFARVKVYENRWTCEVKIPYKSIRFGNPPWGIEIRRYIPPRDEVVYLKPWKQDEQFRISEIPEFAGITPEVKGRFFEVYPVGVAGAWLDSMPTREDIIARAGLDLSWSPTTRFTLNVTVNPDYAEIEADPYSFTLGKYPVYLAEKRPFFLEGQEMFDVRGSFSLGGGPLELFYSRKIGMPAANDYIPIRIGVKATLQERLFEGGIIYAWTGEKNSIPEAHFLVLRPRFLFGRGSGIGAFVEGKLSSQETLAVLSGDVVLSMGRGKALFQYAFCDSSGVKGNGLYATYNWVGRGIWFGVGYKNVDSLFPISSIGYVPYHGEILGGGIGRMHFSIGPFRSLWYGVFGGINRENTPEFSKSIGIYHNFTLRNLWGFNINAHIGEVYENYMDSTYHFITKNIHLSFWNNWASRVHVRISAGGAYSLNYHTSSVGYQTWVRPNVAWRILPQLLLDTGLSLTSWENPDTTEWSDYISWSGDLCWYFSPTLSLAVRLSRTWLEGKCVETRINPVLSWMFSPKSWFYAVYSLYGSGDELPWRDPEHWDSFGVLKVRYLVYF